MLAAYYDVNTKDSFESIFGGLYIGKAPTKSRNSHLVLLFDFSSIKAGSREETNQSVFSNISRSLRRFLFKYQNVLGDVSPDDYIIPGDGASSLENVLVSLELAFTTALKRDHRISFTNVAIPLSLASTSTMPRPTPV